MRSRTYDWVYDFAADERNDIRLYTKSYKILVENYVNKNTGNKMCVQVCIYMYKLMCA